jgi:hypothetical protein
MSLLQEPNRKLDHIARKIKEREYDLQLAEEHI